MASARRIYDLPASTKGACYDSVALFEPISHLPVVADLIALHEGAVDAIRVFDKCVRSNYGKPGNLAAGLSKALEGETVRLLAWCVMADLLVASRGEEPETDPLDRTRRQFISASNQIQSRSAGERMRGEATIFGIASVSAILSKHEEAIDEILNEADKEAPHA